MCTVTFIARRRGFLLGMNRDEQRTRPPALPPKIGEGNRALMLHPSEPGGGTWIGVNQAGVTYALINWYAIHSRSVGHTVSRGMVVTSLLPVADESSATARLESLPLDRMNPFRLLCLLPADQAVIEWRWNRERLVRIPHPWKSGTWISSGHDEPGAQRDRGELFASAQEHSDAGTARWLRRLHRSHGAACGPYSHCMHRPDAATVSYTEVRVTPRRIQMGYVAGSPCAGGVGVTVNLPGSPRSRV